MAAHSLFLPLWLLTVGWRVALAVGRQLVGREAISFRHLPHIPYLWRLRDNCHTTNQFYDKYEKSTTEERLSTEEKESAGLHVVCRAACTVAFKQRTHIVNQAITAQYRMDAS